VRLPDEAVRSFRAYCYNFVTIVIRGVTVVSQRCYSGVTGVLQRCYSGSPREVIACLFSYIRVALCAGLAQVDRHERRDERKM
jgi:hypothetical protein